MLKSRYDEKRMPCVLLLRIDRRLKKVNRPGFVTHHQCFICSSCRDASHRSKLVRKIRTFLPILQNLKHPFSAYREIACLDMDAIEAASSSEM
jgi:hypothetical protein